MKLKHVYVTHGLLQYCLFKCKKYNAITRKWMHDHDLQNPDMHCNWKYMPCFHVDSNYSVLSLNTHLRTKEVIVLRKRLLMSTNYIWIASRYLWPWPIIQYGYWKFNFGATYMTFLSPLTVLQAMIARCYVENYFGNGKRWQLAKFDIWPWPNPWHLDPFNRLVTIHQRYRQDRQTGQRSRGNKANRYL